MVYHWQWIPYVPLGLPLAQEIDKALSASAETDLFVLSNHGLVIGGNDCDAIEELLSEVEHRPGDLSATATPGRLCCASGD